MAATFTWDIVTMERNLLDDIVHTVHYTLVLKDQGETVNAYGSVALDPANPDNIIPYENLEKTIVIGWVKAKLGDEQVTTIETNLKNQLQERLSPQEASGTPW